jgi:hypothetical protein
MRFLRALALASLLAAALLALLTQEIPAQGDELLENGDFEEGSEPWEAHFGELTTSEPGAGRNGSRAGVFTAEETPLHRLSQCIPAWEGGAYEFSAYLSRSPAGPPTVSVRVTTLWYSLDGCSGEEVGGSPLVVVDWRDLETLPLQDAGPWYYLEAGPFPGLLGSRSARLNVFFDFGGDSDATVYLDDFSFRGPAAPSPTPTPTATSSATSTPTPTATSPPTSTATPQPTASPTPFPHSTPGPAPTVSPPRATPSPSSSSGADSPSSPGTRSGLVNGGFEETDREGKLLGWRKYGGELARSADARMEGRFSAAFSSRTESTKWVFQTVRVQGGEAYDLSGYALKNDPDVEAAYLRLSWYASTDGSGQAMGSVDSTSRLTGDSPDFRLLTTGAVAAPAGASSAKTRLMLDPASEAEAIVYFDAISFEQTEMPPPSSEDPPTTPTVVLADEGSPSRAAVLGEESPPTQAATPPTPSSAVESSELATSVPPVSSTSPASSPPSLRTTPSDATPQGAAASASRGQRLSIDGEVPRESAGHMPPTLYRQTKTSASVRSARQEAADGAEGAAWPFVLGLAALAAVLGVGGGVYLWQHWAKRARPP